MSKKSFKKITKKFKKLIIDSHQRLGDETIIIEPDALREICEYLRHTDGMDFNLLRDITAVDYLTREPRYEVVYNIGSLTHGHRIRIRVVVAEGDETVPTISDIWRAANWAEREVWDMYGIRFEGHPDLRRILMYEEFEGHPLRKDYPVQLSQPRMDIRKERDSVEEYKHFFADGSRDASAE